MSKLASLNSNTNRVFWSGGDMAKIAAMDYAKKNGAITLEMTTKGKLLDVATKALGYKRTRNLWNIASRQFALGARGNVNVFINPARFNKAGSVFTTIENPILTMLCFDRGYVNDINIWYLR